MYDIYGPIIGLVLGIITCFFIKSMNLSKLTKFIESFILFGMVYIVVVFIYFSFKKYHFSFIKKNLLKYLIELLFIGIFSYFYFILIYYFRGISIEKDHKYFILLCLLFIIIHTLFELSGVYKRN